MSSKRTLSILTIAGVLGVNLIILASSDLMPGEAAETITADELRSIVHFLASDAMQGRDTGSLTNQITTHYISHRLEDLKLLPAGDDGGYFQEFTLIQSGLGEENHLSVGATELKELALGRDFYPARLSASASTKGQLLFVGYGITAPERAYDDYSGVNAEDKIAVMLTGEPGQSDPDSPFDGTLISDYSRELEKILNAQIHGAAGVLLVSPTAGANLDRRFRHVWPEEFSQSAYTLELWLDQIAIPAAYISPNALPEFFPSDVESFSQLRDRIDASYEPVVFSSELRASLTTESFRERTESRNVLAYLPGSDPQLSNEVVLVGGHLDHVGVEDETSIYNGADDNASGTAGILEIAEAFAHSLNQPRRTVLFAFWNAEEDGLLGSRYYTENPVFPLEETVAVFQLDMIGRNQEVPSPENARFKGLEKQTAAENSDTLNILGYSRSRHMRELAERSNKLVGLRLKFELDNTPLHLLRRSDHWPFLAAGIPVLFFTTGLHPQYHTPQDTADLLNYPKMERVVRLAFFSAWDVANAPSRPELDRSVQGSE